MITCALKDCIKESRSDSAFCNKHYYELIENDKPDNDNPILFIDENDNIIMDLLEVAIMYQVPLEIIKNGLNENVKLDNNKLIITKINKNA